MPSLVLCVILALVAFGQATTGATAQSFPARTVKLIVPFGPGSGADITARLLGDRLSTSWGKPVVVENRPGGDGLIAINAFVSANDDHTLLYAPVALFAVHPYMHDDLSYDADRDLLPIANVSALVMSVAASASSNVDSLGDFIGLARAHPGRYNAAAAPGTTAFLLEGFLKSMNLQMATVPYRDIVQAPRDLSEDRIQLLMSSLAIVQPLAQTGTIRILAVTSRARAASAPDVPTVKEIGYPALELESVQGFFGRRGMPTETRERIAADIRAVFTRDPTIKPRLEVMGLSVELGGPEEFAAGIADMRDKIDAMAKLAGIKRLH